MTETNEGKDATHVGTAPNPRGVISSTAAHTPGPWSFREFHQDEAEIHEMRALGLEPIPALTNQGERSIMASSGRVGLVDCQTKFKRGKGYKSECAERDANARLIAAAPELLSGAKESAAVFEAIAAALRDLGSEKLAELAFTDMYHECNTRAHANRAVIAKATGVAP